MSFGTCPYDGNTVTNDVGRNGNYWRYWHCDACGNRWTMSGNPVAGIGETLR